ncbi:hypothetical protein [Parasediminibacterium sp. JCM 36343]|uniref:hypothetical protein n=1 Tax=Parasediminibacterium sp. JCM 36343 TaxID=3374279 RepID=UPI003978321C
MIDKDLLLKRLSVIKLLYKIGLEQSKQTESISFFSILSFHDSIEMFLKLATEHKNIKSDKFSFIEYWDNMPHLTLKESMRNLNARRVNLKHKGLIPAKIEVEASRVNATDFFEQNTKATFDIEFSEISLFELIKFSETKRLLILSQDFLDKNEIENCVENVTMGFYELLVEYKENKKDWGNRTHFNFTEKIRFNSYNSMNQRNDGSEKRLEDVFEKVNTNFEQIEKALEVISLGFDYRKYSKFKMLTPITYRMSSGNYHMEIMRKKNWSNENCQFLIDFVLDCALKLQEFDFDNENLEPTEPFILEVE